VRRLLPLLCVLALAGCGGTVHRSTAKAPRIPRALAQSWAQQSDAIASALGAGDGCAAQQRATSLRSQVIAAVNDRQLPRRFLEPLTSAVNDLAGRITCTPPPAATTPAADGRGHGRGHGKGHGNDQGNGGG
jgi:hypothetical protein